MLTGLQLNLDLAENRMYVGLGFFSANKKPLAGAGAGAGIRA